MIFAVQLVTREISRGGRVVCFSDIHGNRAALEAVLERAPLASAELVVVNGDVVNRGPRSDGVWDRLEELRDERWVISGGNHERYVTNHLLAPESVPSGLMGRVHQTSRFTFEQLGARARALVGLPDGVELRAPGLGAARVVHASMAGDEAGLDPRTPAETARARVGAPCPLMVVGHVHRRLDFRVGSTRIVNAGSVGSACDGIRAAGWVELEARPEGWAVYLRRVGYDVEHTARDYERSGFLDAGGPVAALVRREWELAAPVVRPWLRAEIDRVRAGDIGLEASIDAWLAPLADRPSAPRGETATVS